MKTLLHLFLPLLMLLCIPVMAQTSRDITGAWEKIDGNSRMVMICTDKYFSTAVYDTGNNNFIGTYGGSYTIDAGQFVEMQEFNTMNSGLIGKSSAARFEIKNGRLLLDENKVKEQWSRIDDGGPGKLAGAWLITGRMQNEKMSAITPAARRTMKILSGKRFQWIAYNVDTKEFFGTGGGTYTTENGKYKEAIEFFSRDNTRVGKTLEFEFSLNGDSWRHKGFSSKGDPIDEIWTRREKIGL